MYFSGIVAMSVIFFLATKPKVLIFQDFDVIFFLAPKPKTLFFSGFWLKRRDSWNLRGNNSAGAGVIRQ
jgi:hypothetical protein